MVVDAIWAVVEAEVLISGNVGELDFSKLNEGNSDVIGTWGIIGGLWVDRS